MNEIPLKDFLKENTQQAAGELIGCTQGAIYQMLLNQRDIRLVFNLDGTFEKAFEVKPLTKTA